MLIDNIDPEDDEAYEEMLAEVQFYAGSKRLEEGGKKKTGGWGANNVEVPPGLETGWWSVSGRTEARS